jgi:hypothetical protein
MMTLQNELRAIAQVVQSFRPALAQRLMAIATRVGRLEMQCDDIAADAQVNERLRHEALAEQPTAVVEFRRRPITHRRIAT